LTYRAAISRPEGVALLPFATAIAWASAAIIKVDLGWLRGSSQ
jgi:hypothetical protein